MGVRLLYGVEKAANCRSRPRSEDPTKRNASTLKEKKCTYYYLIRINETAKASY
jgi:hypothetical protein